MDAKEAQSEVEHTSENVRLLLANLSKFAFQYVMAHKTIICPSLDHPKLLKNNIRSSCPLLLCLSPA